MTEQNAGNADFTGDQIFESLADDQSVAIAEKCMFRPTVDEILAEIFGGYKFYLDEEEMHPSEVFATDSMLPLFSAIAINRAESIFGFPLYVPESENEDAMFGIEVAPDFPSAAPFIIYTLQLISVVEDIFGKRPCKIVLDELYAWASSEELQQAGLPYLGMKN